MKLSVDLKVADKAPKRRELRSCSRASRLVRPRLRPLSALISASAAGPQRGTKVTGEWDNLSKRKTSTFWASAQLSQRAKALCTFLSTLTLSLPVCGSDADVRSGLVDFGGRGGGI